MEEPNAIIKKTFVYEVDQTIYKRLMFNVKNINFDHLQPPLKNNFLKIKELLKKISFLFHNVKNSVFTSKLRKKINDRR